jgi:hypothetical protein
MYRILSPHLCRRIKENYFKKQFFLPSEENRVLRECNRESFWYRSLPLGAILASLTHVAILRGILKPSLRFGSGPKGGTDNRYIFVMVSVFLLWCFGSGSGLRNEDCCLIRVRIKA